MKKLLILLTLIGLACVPVYQEPDLVESIGIKGKTTVNFISGDDTTLLYESNSVHDSLIHKFMQWTANGESDDGSGGAEYFWVWHTEDGTYYWSQVLTSDQSGGGDTAASLVQVGTYVAETGITYDTTIRYRWVASGYVWSGSITDSGYIDLPWCEQKADTFVLGSAGELEITWTMTLTGSAAIYNRFLYHLIRGYQVDLCDIAIDTFYLMWQETEDTNVIVPSVFIDYANDTVTYSIYDTARALDTLDKIMGKDNDGDTTYFKDVSLHFGADTVPLIKVKIYFSETP